VVRKCQHPQKSQPMTLAIAAYRSEFAGMVGSMETTASSVVRREMVVFLQDTLASELPECTRGTHARPEPGTHPPGQEGRPAGVDRP
jgi:hypothetical protein